MLIQWESGLVAALCSWVVLLDFIEKTDLQESVDLAFDSEGTGHDRVLEIGDSLVDLVSFSEDCTKLEENFTLLIEVGWHLKDCNKSTDRMFIRFKLLIEDADSVP